MLEKYRFMKYKNFSKNTFFLTLISILLLTNLSKINAQSIDKEAKNKDLVQFSGVIMAIDSLPIFYANLQIKGQPRGASSDINGYFSFVAKKGDTIQISALGYHFAELSIPSELTGMSYSVIQFLEKDTIQLPTAIVYPWPTPREFRSAFLNVEVPDDDFQRARRNLAREKMREMGEVMAMDGRENFKYQSQQYANRAYYAGQYAPMQIFNPLAWIQFFKALKRGDFKSKKKKKSKNKSNNLPNY